MKSKLRIIKNKGTVSWVVGAIAAVVLLSAIVLLSNVDKLFPKASLEETEGRRERAYAPDYAPNQVLVKLRRGVQPANLYQNGSRSFGLVDGRTNQPVDPVSFLDRYLPPNVRATNVRPILGDVVAYSSGAKTCVETRRVREQPEIPSQQEVLPLEEEVFPPGIPPEYQEILPPPEYQEMPSEPEEPPEYQDQAPEMFLDRYEEEASPPGEEMLPGQQDYLPDSGLLNSSGNKRFFAQSAANLSLPPSDNIQCYSNSQLSALRERGLALPSSAAAITSRRPTQIDPAAEQAGLDRWYVVNLQGNNINAEQVANQLKNSPYVETAQPNYYDELAFIPNDPFFHSSNSWGQGYDDLWGLKKIQADRAWDTATGQGVIVAVVDTGIDFNHPDLQNNIWRNTNEIPNNGIDDDHNGFIDDVNGWDFVNNDNRPQDGHGHGSHVAGIIAAVMNNNQGIAGVAPSAKIMPLKGLSDQGSGAHSNLAQAIYYAVSNGAKIINASWGGRDSNIKRDAFNYALRNGVIVVAAAGNRNSNLDTNPYYPASYDGVITVGASNEDDQKTYFSNYGLAVDVSAPGGGRRGEVYNILSTVSDGTRLANRKPDLKVSNGYYRLAGTSMAAPYVSGIAALVLSKLPSISLQRMTAILRYAVDSLSEGDKPLGTGRINAAKAVAVNADNTPPLVRLLPLQRITAGNNLSFTVNATDLDGDTLSFQLTNPPPGSTFNAANKTFNWTPPLSQPLGVYQLIFEVSDGRLTSILPVLVEVENTQPPPPSPSPQKTSTPIFWADVSAKWIRGKVDVNGRQTQVIIPAGDMPTAVAVDGNQGKVYWAVRGGLIKRANFNGSNVEIVKTGAGYWIYDLAVDTAANKLYWSNHRGGAVYRSNLDGTQKERVLGGLNRPVGIALGNNNLYAVTAGGRRIVKYDLTTRRRQEINIPYNRTAWEVTFDPTSGDLYWTTWQAGEIWKIKADFTGSQQLVVRDPEAGRDSRMRGIAVDPANSTLYWALEKPNLIRKIVLNQSGSNSSVVTEPSFDNHVIFDVAVAGGSVSPPPPPPPPTNHPPVFQPVSPQTVVVNQNLIFTVNADDPDNDPLTYRMISGPQGALFNTSTRTFSWTPTVNQIDNYLVRFSVNDGRGGTDILNVRITVEPANQPPYFVDEQNNRIDVLNKTAETNQFLSFRVRAVDPDGDLPLFYFVDPTTLIPEGADFVLDTFRWRPNNEQIGTYQFVIKARDTKGRTGSLTVNIAVRQANRPPQFNPVPPQRAEANQNLTFTINAEDPDPGDQLTYSMVSGPTGSLFDSTTRTFSWTPDSQQIGRSFPVIFRVVDSRGAADVLTVSITVTPPTIIDGIYWTGLFGNQYRGQIKVSDFQGQNIDYVINREGRQIEIDEENNKIYWMTKRAVYRVDIRERGASGDEAELVFQLPPTERHILTGITIAGSGNQRYLYAMSAYAKRMFRVNVHTGQQTELIGYPVPLKLIVDFQDNVWFFSEDGGIRIVKYNPNTKQEVTSIYVTDDRRGWLKDIDFDPINRRLYWVDKNNDVWEANTNLTKIKIYDSSGSETFEALAVDPAGSKVYLLKASAGGYSIVSLPIRGGSPETVLTSDQVGRLPLDLDVFNSSSPPPPPPNQSPYFVDEQNNRIDVFNKLINVRQLLKFTVNAKDPDNDPLTYSVTNLPQGAQFDPSTREFEWRPPATQAGSYTVRFDVVDDRGGRGTLTVNITVNAPPQFESIPPQTVVAGQNITFTVNAVDPDGDPLTYEMTSITDITRGANVEGAVFDTVTRTFSWTPTFTQIDTYWAIFVVRDNKSGVDTLSVLINVRLDRAPVFQPISAQTVTVGERLTFTVHATDPDNDPLTYSMPQAPQGAQFNPSTQEFSWIPSANQVGNHQVVFSASDGYFSGTLAVAIRVNPPNRPPQFQPIPPQTVTVGQTLTFTVNADDPDNDQLTYAMTNNLPNAQFSPSSRVFRFTPTVYQIGRQTAQFSVDDGRGGTDSLSVDITVERPNQSPYFVDEQGNVITSIDKTIRLGRFLFERIQAVDPDGDRITYSVSQLPQGAVFSQFSKFFFWWPSLDQVGRHTVVFTASDGQASSQLTYNINVINPDTNRPPRFQSLPDQTITVNQNLTFTVNADDPDGDSLTYGAVNLPNGSLFNPVTHTFSWTPTPLQAGEHTVIFTVTDGTANDSLLVRITVNPNNTSNRSPYFVDEQDNQISALDETAVINQLVTFNVRAVDPDQDPLTYSMPQAPQGAQFNPSTREFRWTPTQDGNYTAQIVAEDGKGGRGALTVNIEVSSNNQLQIVHVTNLNAEGPGSLREALKMRGRRKIVFDVGGVIDLRNTSRPSNVPPQNNGFFYNLEIPRGSGNVEIAGETAPDPGITIIGAGLVIRDSNVVVRHLRIRSGRKMPGPDHGIRNALLILADRGPVSDVRVENVSLSWGTDQVVGIDNVRSGNRISNITLSKVIIAEGLDYTQHPKVIQNNRGHSHGLLVGSDVDNLTIYQSLFAHHRKRTPWINGGSSARIVNNVIYNTMEQQMTIVNESRFNRPTNLTLVGNVAIQGNNTYGDGRSMMFWFHPTAFPVNAYLQGNTYLTKQGRLLGSDWNVGWAERSLPSQISQWGVNPSRISGLTNLSQPNPSLDGLTVISGADNIINSVLNNAGAFPRDSIDKRIVNTVKKKTGWVINSEDEVGGLPR